MLYKTVLLVLIFFATLFGEGIDYSAILKKPQNDVTVHREDQTITVKEDSEYIFTGDVIETGSNSNATLIFNDGTIVNIDSKSILKVDDYLFKPSDKQYKLDLFLKEGVVTFESGKMGEVAPEKISFNVPEGTIAVRGTKFLVEVR